MSDQTAADLLFGGSMRTSAEVAKGITEAKAAPGSVEEKAAKIYTGPEKYVSPFDKPKAEAAPAAQPHEETKQEAQKEEAPANSPEAVKALSAALETEMGLDPSDPINAELANLAAGELGLDKDGTIKLVELDRKNREAYWGNASEQWQQATLSEFSEPDLSSARQAVHRYGDAELSELLNAYGLGNHPAIVRFARNVANAAGLPHTRIKR